VECGLTLVTFLSQKNIVVPAVMPTKERRGSNNDKDDGDTDMITTAGIGRKSQGGAAAPAYTFIQPPNPAEERRKLLQEVKDHLALLKEFEDIAGEEEILKRRRDLFAALPPIPPPYNSNKRARLG